MRLTGPNVSKLSLPAGKSETIIFDDALPGFGVRLRAGGKRVWVAQYRVGSKQRRVTIGNVEAIGADRARSAAKDILAKVQLGSDPQREKVATRQKAVVTLGAVADLYLEGPAKDRLRDRSYVEVDRHFRQHWKPLRETPIHQVGRADIASRLAAVKSDNGPFAANRARASLSALFGWAMREGLVEANPVIGTNKATEEVSRDRVLSDEELSLVWRHAGGGDYGAIVRLLILTGQRREEVGGMMHSELNASKALWSLPRERTKNGLPHDVPLSPAVLHILFPPTVPIVPLVTIASPDGAEPAVLLSPDAVPIVPKAQDRDLLFGSRVGPFSGWSKSKAALNARIAAAIERDAQAAGVKPRPMPPWRLHDIRRTMATRLGDLGVLPHVVEAVLNHVSGHRAGVAGIYNRATYAGEKRAALDVWATRVLELGSTA